MDLIHTIDFLLRFSCVGLISFPSIVFLTVALIFYRLLLISFPKVLVLFLLPIISAFFLLVNGLMRQTLDYKHLHLNQIQIYHCMQTCTRHVYYTSLGLCQTVQQIAQSTSLIFFLIYCWRAILLGFLIMTVTAFVSGIF